MAPLHPAHPVLAVLLLLSAARAQFLQQIVTAQDPALALQPPPLQQAQFANFHTAPPATAFLQPLPLARQQPQPQPQPLAHHSVVRNSEEEARLPAELRSHFYDNPRIAERLAKESWFTPGEEHVLEREAEKIPREQVYKLLKNAGLVRRR